MKGVADQRVGCGCSNIVERQCRVDQAAAVEIEDHQRRHFVTVDACYHHVAHQRRASRDEPRAQRTDADPGAAGELEILGDAAIEIEAGVKIARIRGLDRVPEFIKTFLVERFRCQLRLPPIARRDVRPFGANLQLAVVGDQLGIVAGHGKPDMAGAAGARIDRHEERRGLGGAKPRQDRHAVAGFLHAELIEAVPDKRRQRRAGKEHRVQRREEFCAQRLVVAQVRQQRFIALRHVEIDCRRNLAEIAHGLLDAAGHRLAGVEIHRAAVVQRQPDVVIAAKGVIPRQPVDDHRRLVLQEGHGFADHHLVGADHALGIDDRLGIAGRARGQKKFCDGVRPDRVMRGIEARMQRRRHQIGEQGHITPGQRAIGSGDLGAGWNVGFERIGEFVGVVDKDQARRQQLHQIGKLAVVF